MLAVEIEIINMQAGVWEFGVNHERGGFVDVNGLVSCEVYAQSLINL